MVAERRTAETPVALRAPSISAVSDPAAGHRDLHADPDPEVPEKAVRRRFTVAYKLRILKEAQACKGTSQCGALLRREGLYSSHLTTWRRQVEKGTLEALSPRKRGPKAAFPNPLKKRVETLEKETQRLRHQLKQAEIIIEVQKTISEILHLPPDPKGEER
jgi:transposase-like protein